MILFEDEASAVPTITIGEDVVSPARIKVVGVGGGGGNAVNRMIQAGIRGVEFIAANTDLQVLKVNRAAQKIQLGLSTSKGMGAGSNPEIGRTRRPRGRRADRRGARRAPTWSSSPPAWAAARGPARRPSSRKIASEAGALVVAIVSKPFAFEGRRKLRFAEDGIAELREYVDTLITIPNERLYAFVDRNITAWEAFKIADDVLRQAVQGISDLITVPGYVNVDFADVKTVMENMGMALMGTGTATGEHRAVEAAQKAISNPLLEEQSIQGARAILINVTGGEDLTLAEFNEACQIVQQAADDDANIIFGLVQDGAMKDQVKVSVIATGFDAPVAARRVAAQVTERVRPQLTEEMVPEDSGYGVNLVNVRSPKDDIFDIPTFLRQADGLSRRLAPARSARVVTAAGLEFAVGSGATADAAEGGAGWSSRAAGHCWRRESSSPQRSSPRPTCGRGSGSRSTRPSSGSPPAWRSPGSGCSGPGNGGWWRPARPANACWLGMPPCTR